MPATLTATRNYLKILKTVAVNIVDARVSHAGSCVVSISACQSVVGITYVKRKSVENRLFRGCERPDEGMCMFGLRLEVRIASEHIERVSIT